MSDPVTNVEIEDVLSSIRRLVAEGDKSKRAENSKASEKPAAPEKLVLTPALRVPVDHGDSDEVSDADDQQQDDTDAQDNTSEQQDSGAEQDVVDDTPMAFVAAEVIFDEETEDVADDATDPNVEAANDDDVPFDRATLEKSTIPFDRANLEATIAELEAAVTEQPDEWEPDGSDTDLEPTWAAAGFPSDQPVEDAIEVPDPVEATSETLDDTPDDNAPAFASFRHAEIDDVDTDHGDDLRTTDDAPNDADLAAYLADDNVIDEDMLRQMVLEIVRSELQGKLGERITRNVRKLVRREIHRVLTSQDID